jgi:uncharacterized membrane protein
VSHGLANRAFVFYRTGMDAPVEKETKLEREEYDFFLIGILIKGGQGVIELIAGIVTLFIPLNAVVRLADHFTEVELAKDPDDYIATHLFDFAHSLSVGMKEAVALYLLINAVIKIFLAIALLRGKKWAYPTALAALGLFIAYLFYRLYLHPSILLSLAILLDALVLFFILVQYRRVLKGTNPR